MADYFTSEHFKLLNRWKGQKRDDSNPEQSRAYEELKKAYELTEIWAKSLQKDLFPQGRVEIRKRPTNQGNNFAGYNWAKIYPYEGAPKELAYTVGIDAGAGFVVKIDTVGLDDSDPIRRSYADLRGSFDNSSGMVAQLPASEGLSKSLAELVEWSGESIRKFSLRYDEVVNALKLGQSIDDATLLSRFDGKADFKAARSRWSEKETEQFCRLARAVHAAGLDWWHTEIKAPQVRFGRKQPGQARAAGVLGYVYCGKSPMLQVNTSVDGLKGLDWVRLSESIIDDFSQGLDASREAIEFWKPVSAERAGLWPDQLQAEPSDPAHQEPEPVIEIERKMSASRRKPFNRIYYGPPGTGKTHELRALLKSDYTLSAQSVSAEDWHSSRIASEITSLTWWEAIAAALYDIGGTAKVSQILEHPFVMAMAAARNRTSNIRQTVWGSLQQHAVEESVTVKVKARIAPLVFDKTADSIWSFAGDWQEECSALIALVDEIREGPKGDGKNIERFTFVTFHQSYGYEEFVEGLRPLLHSESDSIAYEIRRGAFVDLCERARQDPEHHYAVVIDEINRGNISKIFGELITLIEVDKRDPLDGSGSGAVLRLAYSKEQFAVPANVDLIGSMNTADRSLALVDTALRRRFDFVPRMPDTRSKKVHGQPYSAPLADLWVNHQGSTIDIRRMLKKMNERIETLYDRDHTIGHAYFTPLWDASEADRFGELAEIFRNRIIPLLEEYFFEDWQKIRLVLGDNQKLQSAQFVTVKDDQESDLASLFGSDHGVDMYSSRRRFRLDDSAFHKSDAYLGIYE